MIIPHLDSIYHGDCRDLLADLPDESVDLVVSSPPYNIGKEYEKRTGLDAYLEQQREVLRECVRVLSPSGSLFWQIGAYADRGVLIPLDVRFFPMLESLGLIPRNRIIWARQHGLHAKKKFSCRHETILWFTKTNDYAFDLADVRVPQKYKNKKHHKGKNHGEFSCNPDGKNPGDIWLFRNVKHNHEEQTLHPCQFPEDMIARILLATTREGDVVLDPYMGTGTVAVVASENGRHFVGAEVDTQYHSTALQRLSGEPDRDGVFPNLKALRDFCERTGHDVQRYRFAAQTGRQASDRSRAKIHTEEHHLEEMETRLAYEEAAFGARMRGEEPPADRRLNGKSRETPLFS